MGILNGPILKKNKLREELTPRLSSKDRGFSLWATEIHAHETFLKENNKKTDPRFKPKLTLIFC